MKQTIAIIGSRTFNNYSLLEKRLSSYIVANNIDATIVSGGAKGADTLGIEYAKDNNLKWHIHKADWKNISHPDARIKQNQYGEYDANAGHRRNQLIIDDCDVVIAFTNGSSGTADSLKKAKAAGKETIVVNF